MNNITFLPTKFTETDNPAEKFRQLALDAEKFPDRYHYILVVCLDKKMDNITKFSGHIPHILKPGLCDEIEDLLMTDYINDELD
jgi:hypothetical protein